MHKLCIFIVSLSLLFALSYGRVKPDGARSIVLSSTNAGEISNYNFSMALDTELPSNGVIEITFPFNQYIAGLGLPYDFKVYAPYPNRITATLDSDTAKTVICNVGHRKANESFTIEIQDVRNPSKIGGTGNFKVSSKVVNKVLDTNFNFGLIGIFEESTTLLSAQVDFVDGESERAGEYTSYVMSFIPSVNLPANIDIKIIFPDVYDFTSVEATQCSETGGLGLNLTCVTNQQLKNVIVFQGFTNTISQGTVIQLKLKDVLNPMNEMTTEALSYWVREVGTNNTIQRAEGVPGLYIQPGTISSVTIANAVPYFPLYTNIDRELILSFRPSNPFNVIKIGTSFPLIKSCTVINGLSMVNEITPILCSASSHVIVVKGQRTYTPEDIYLKTVQIKFMATLPDRNVLTNKVEIYTYLDEGFITKVDEDTDSSASQVQIQTLTTVASVSSTLTATSTVPSGANTITFTINPNATYTAAPKIVVELSRKFTGVPICSYALLDSATFTTKTCSLSQGVLTIQLNDDVGLFIATSTTPVRVQIDGLYNPALPKTYYIRYYVYSSASVIAESYLDSFDVVTNPIVPGTTSMLPLADALDHVTIYVLKFVTPNFLEDGLFLLEEPNKLSSRIDILFNMKYTSSDTFAYDLGSGLADRSNYPCEFVGLDPSVFATKPRCILIQGPSTGATTTDVAIIRVLDFNAVLQGTTLTVNIPVKNSQLGSTAPQATVRTYTVRDYQEFRTSEIVIPLATTTTNLGTGGTAGAISLTNSSVQAKSDLTFTFTTTSAITAGSNNSIQIEYPKGYKFLPSDITVRLDGTAVSANKLHFADAFNFFTIELAANLAASSHTIIISNMTTPNASLATGNDLIVRTTRLNAYVNSITFNIPTIQPGADVDGIVMDITPNTFSYPYAAYEFNFTTAAYSPSTASIQVIFPASYTFDGYAECTSTDGLLDRSSTDHITCAFSGNTLTITKFAALIPGQDISIDVFGISNPSASISGSSFVINILDSSSNKIESLTLAATGSTIVGPAFASRDLNVSVSRMIPRNPLVDASYLMTMDPGYNLPKGAVMTMNFDPAFSVLFTETVDLIGCVAQGGLYSLTQCSVSGVQLTIAFGETSNATVPIDIHYFGLIRFPSASTTLTGFSATVTYKGITIAQSTTFPTLSTSTAIIPLSDITMDYYPRNEGEMANYIFKFNLTTTTLTEDMYFLVRFPHEYDPDLFKYIPVAESPNLVGYLNAEVLSRGIKIYGFQNMTVDGPITLRLWGIVNPNKVDISRTGTFTVALMLEDDAIEANFNIPGIVPLLAPDSIQFISLASSVSYARHTSDYTLNFLSRKTILPSRLGGYLFMDFPPDFLIDSYAGKCDIDEDFSFFVSCSLDHNRLFVNASNPEWTTLMGSLSLYLQDIRTPDLAGETLNFVVSNYDSSGKKVLSRTYSNLNPASVNYTYDGLQISVNDDEDVSVEVGTYTDEIVIKMPGPSLQAITLTPNTLDASILVTPFPLKIELGDTEARFRVAAPRTIMLKKFYITWSKTGDSLVTTYANLKRTTLRMRKGWVKREVKSEDMEFIPVGGITFPLLVLTNNPPYTDLLVNIFVRNSDTLATVSKSSVTLTGGVFNQNYSISVDTSHALTFVEIGFSLGGTDGDSFELASDFISIPITAKETFLPSILSGVVVNTTRSKASFTVTSNTLSFIYYVIGYKNMPIPTFENVSNRTANQTLLYSSPIYGETYIKKTPKTITWTVSNLKPSRDYVIYAYVMNLNQINNPSFLQLEFSTNAPHRIAEFILPIKQSSVAKDIKKEIISRIALMLSIDRTRLIEKFTDCAQSQDSLYYHAANTTYFHINLLPDPTSENDNSTPLQLVRNLNSRTDEIKEFIPRLADGDLLQIQDLPYDIPTFTVKPAIKKNDYEALTFSVTLGRCGYIHAVAIPIADSQNNTATDLTVYKVDAPATDVYPSSFQIYSGYNDSNQPAISASMRVSDFALDYDFTISGLKDHLIYNVYISTENDWPAYTQLLPDASVSRTESKTVKKRKPLNVFSINIKDYVTDTESSSPLKRISWIGLFITLIFVLIA